MALARTYAMALAGVRVRLVEVEADIENCLVALLLVGLPDTALRGARDRIRSAIVNIRHTWPQRRITVGLSPASLSKRVSSFDVATRVLAYHLAHLNLLDLASLGEKSAPLVHVVDAAVRGTEQPVLTCRVQRVVSVDAYALSVMFLARSSHAAQGELATHTCRRCRCRLSLLPSR